MPAHAQAFSEQQVQQRAVLLAFNHPLDSQFMHSAGWLACIMASTPRTDSLTAGLSVATSMPSLTGVLQAGCRGRTWRWH